MFEEPLFSIESCCVSYEIATWTDDTMTRDNYEYWIFIICASDGSDSSGIPCESCLLSVVPSLSVGDFLEGMPCGFLKISSLKCKRKIEYSSISTKIFSELEGSLFENLRRSIEGIIFFLLKNSRLDKCKSVKMCLTRMSYERPERCLDESGSEHMMSIWKKLSKDSFYRRRDSIVRMMFVFPEKLMTPFVSLVLAHSFLSISLMVLIFPLFVPVIVPSVTPLIVLACIV